jgi:hypothetical protein
MSSLLPAKFYIIQSSSLVSNDGSNNSNKLSNLNETNQSASAFLVCQNTPFLFKSPSLVYITTSNIASKASDCCSHHGSNSMSSLSLATAKHLRNVVPYTITPFEKQGIQGNAEKSRTPLMHLYQFHQLLLIWIQKKVKILMDIMANSRKFLKNMAQQIYEDEVEKCCYESLTWAGAKI